MSNPQLATKFYDNFSGWRLVFSIVGATALLVAFIIAIYGTGELGIRLWLKVTGRLESRAGMIPGPSPTEPCVRVSMHTAPRYS